MKKSLIIISSFIVMVGASFAFTNDEPKYKNLKILPRNITEKQMDSVMHHYTASLGVKCNFCHVRTADGKEWDHASDKNKHKLIARDMMKLTNAINDKYFDVTGNTKDINARLMVTCYTCHHGAKDPATTPPAEERRGPQRSSSDSTRRTQTDSTKRTQ